MRKKIANWGNFPAMESDERCFSLKTQLVQIMKEEGSCIPRGNGRCYGDASLAAKTLSTLKYDKVLSFDKEQGLFECQSGITLDRVLEIIVPNGWFLPVTPGTKFITVGGAVGSDVHGKNHHAEGSFSNHVTEMDIVLEEGETLTCSPIQYADLFEATCGGMGLTGVITRVKFRLKKIESVFVRQKQIKAQNLDEIIRLFEAYNHYTYSVAWIDCFGKGNQLGRSILFLGEHARVTELGAKQQARPFWLRRKKQISLPFYLPSWALNPFMVKTFNWLYYNRNPEKELDRMVSYETFFYPLDAILHWNRGYGKKGFLQYQFLLPLDGKQGLIEILERISARNLGSFLAVLKVFGKQESIISFPKEGYTLALDFPLKAGLFEFLDELDEVVLRYGGRLYLSKDARMKPEVLSHGYPGLDKFREILGKYNPAGKIHSRQSERLLITATNP